jgi:CheY-like chemotaxis protein
MLNLIASPSGSSQRPSFSAGSHFTAEELQSETKVLVVDDSQLARRAVVRIVRQQLGLQVIEARDARQALAAIARESPAVVLTDLQMPHMSGLDLVGTLREQHPDVAVILMTAYGSEETALQALRAGASHYVPKKELGTVLADTLRRVLELTALKRRRREAIGHLQARGSQYEIGNASHLITPLIQLLLDDLVLMDLFDSTEQMQTCVALQEALTNALYHGNLEVSSDLRQEDEANFYALAEQRRGLEPFRDRRIQILARVDRVQATFVITDQGPGFDTSLLDHDVDAEDMRRIGGRGLLLIRACMNEVRHNESGNQITLIKRCRTAARDASRAARRPHFGLP